MGRNSITEAIILKASRFGEYHKRLSLLTIDRGIIETTAYGAFKSKSKLSGITESFVHIKAYLYFEPVKQRYKLNDAEAIATFDGIRGNLKSFYAASLLAEVVLVTYAGGDEHRRLFPLLSQGLALLEKADSRECDLLLVQQLVRFLEIIGYPPVWHVCDRCGGTIERGIRRHVSTDGSILCDNCKTPDSSVISVGAMAYLEHTTSGTLEAATRVDLEARSLSQLKRGLVRIVQNVVERPLRSIQGAESILLDS